MATLLAIPILVVLVIVQSAVLSYFPLLRGTLDPVLLTLLAWTLQKRVTTAWQWGIIGGLLVTFISALPLGAALAGYLASVALALALKRQVWQLPILAMLVATFLGTLITHLVSLVALTLTGNPLPWGQAFNLITLPSLLLNLLFAVPAYGFLSDLANWLYPEELEI